MRVGAVGSNDDPESCIRTVFAGGSLPMNGPMIPIVETF